MGAGHLLHELGHPTLLIAGIWDFLTPAYNMVTMNRAGGPGLEGLGEVDRPTLLGDCLPVVVSCFIQVPNPKR